MATDPIVPFQFPAVGSAESPKVQADFEALLKYIRERNDGTVAWDSLFVTGNVGVGTTTVSDKVTIVTTSTTRQIRLGDTDVANFYGFIHYDDASNTRLKIGNSYTTGEIEFLKAGTTQTMFISGNGEITQPLQPCFRATSGSVTANVTGDGTLANGDFDSEVYDIGSNYDTGTNNGTFTAPVSGKYFFSVGMYIVGVTTAYTGFVIRLVTSNQSYFISDPATTNVSDKMLSMSILCDMDANDTARIQYSVSGGGKTVEQDTDARNEYFCGGLIN